MSYDEKHFPMSSATVMVIFTTNSKFCCCNLGYLKSLHLMKAFIYRANFLYFIVIYRNLFFIAAIFLKYIDKFRIYIYKSVRHSSQKLVCFRTVANYDIIIRYWFQMKYKRNYFGLIRKFDWLI